MPDDVPRRSRSGVYRHRATELRQKAEREFWPDERRRLLDMAQTYERAAEAIKPALGGPDVFSISSSRKRSM